jgi:hypothetical protein
LSQSSLAAHLSGLGHLVASQVQACPTLDQTSIDFFKAEAERLNVPYQRMIRNLLQQYVEQHKRNEQPHTAS